MMQLTYEGWGDADRQYVRDLQTDGFDARVWELYLAGTLKALGFELLPSNGRPDFHCRSDQLEFFVEASTANASGGTAAASTATEWFDRLRQSTNNRDEVAVRFGSVLRSKAQKDYQQLPHVAGSPLVLAVQAFFEPGALLHNDLPLQRYLYGLSLADVASDGQVSLTNAKLGDHIGDTKPIKSGWFDQEGNEHISGVLWSNSGTAGKFNRLGLLAGYASPEWAIHRYGTELNPDPGATERAIFIEQVGRVSEPWEEGLVLMHNPHALNPLPDSVFGSATQIRKVNGALQYRHVGRRIFSQLSIAHPSADTDRVLALIRTQLDLAHVV